MRAASLSAASRGSGLSITASGTAAKKLGHPVPDSYLVLLLNTGDPEMAPMYVPAFLLSNPYPLVVLPVYGVSVAASREIACWKGVSFVAARITSSADMLPSPASARAGLAL